MLKFNRVIAELGDLTLLLLLLTTKPNTKSNNRAIKRAKHRPQKILQAKAIKQELLIKELAMAKELPIVSERPRAKERLATFGPFRQTILQRMTQAKLNKTTGKPL